MPFNETSPAAKSPGRKGFLLGAASGVGLAAVLAVGVGSTLSHAQNAPPAQAQNAPAKMAASPSFGPAPGAPQSFADIFEKVAPAVVSINVTAKVTQAELGELQGIPFPFNQLPQFRNPNGGGGTGRATPGQRTPNGRRGAAPDGDGADQNDLPEAQAAGSGFFISKDGYIVTNNHVVENATKITVVLNDKRELPATVVGRDEDSDIAVVKVQGSNFAFVNFENQAKPRVGDWVLAVGNPLQLGGTATAGIVSAIGRDIPQDTPGSLPSEYLQIDAPINRGNSGGPTFDIYGRVVGVNTAIYSQTGGSIGIGFAVPADTADMVVRELIAGRTISRGYLGASIQNIVGDTAESLGIPVNSGAFIAEVTPGGPGAKAGLQPGDIVLGINGRKVSGSSELTREVARTHAGEVMHLEVRRGGRVQTINVTAGKRPSAAVLNRANGGADDGSDAGAGATTKPEAGRQAVLGMEVTPLDAAARRDNNIAADVRGVVVQSVSPTSDAGKKSLKKGDVIVQANERPVSTPQEFAAAVADARKAGRPSVFLLVNRAGRNSGIPIKLDPTPPAK